MGIQVLVRLIVYIDQYVSRSAYSAPSSSPAANSNGTELVTGHWNGIDNTVSPLRTRTVYLLHEKI
jgi:hypothetical protein